MPSVFQSHPNRDEPQRLTAVASRASEDIALRPRRERDISVLYNQNNTSTPEELAFQLNDLPQVRTSPARVSVSVNSILANSNHSSGEDVVPPVLEPVPSSQLRTSTFTNLASQLLSRVSTSSSSSSNGTYNQTPSGLGFDRSLIGSPEFDKIIVDSAPITQAPTSAAHGNGRVDVNSDSVGPSASARTIDGNFQQRPVRARLSSDMSSLQQEMENNAYTTNSPVSEATYMQMRKTLDPEALLNGDTRGGAAVLGSLRPIANPFSLAHEDVDFQSFQRRRAATTGTAPTAGPTFGAPTSFRIPGSNRSQRSWTVPGNRLSSIPATAPVLLANDPRGTFRTTTADTTQQIFAAQQVRLQNKWQTDVWIYMKNSHPFLGICTAHRWHPYKKQDRVLVLIVTLLLTVLLCGIYATQDCCKTSLDSSVAVVSSSTGHRLLSEEYYYKSASNEHQPSRVLTEDLNCQPFGAHCGSSSNSLCTLGSSCQNSTCVANQPNASATVCSTNAQCPTGWRCSTASQRCRPSTSLVCYLPADQTKSRGVAFALTEDEETTATPTTTGSGSGSNGESAPVDAISALANLLKYAKDNNITTDGSTVVIPTPAPSPTPTPTPTPKLGSNSTTPSKNQTTNASGDSGSGSGSGEAATAVTSAPSKDAVDDAFEVEKLLITLTKPTNGGVYGVSATIPIAWEVKLLQGQRSFVNALKFRVDFSRDGKAFDIVLASNIATDTPASTATNTTQYHFDWKLAQNESLTCTDCVLRVCTQSEDSSVDPVCIRTDGASTTTTSTRSDGALTATAASSKITFHIVREIIECSCGLQNASFVTYAYLIALVFPVAFLVLEQFVTFYQDSKVFGMFARRGGPKMPVVGFYAAEATKRGRIVLGWLLLGLVFGCGMVGARITSDKFLTSTGDITVLWLVMFLLVLVIGFIYTSIVYIVLFTMRWNQDKGLLNQPGDLADLNDFGGMMFLDNQDPHGGLSYQWPPPQSIPTNSSRSNGVTDSSRSTAVVVQQPGLAMV